MTQLVEKRPRRPRDACHRSNPLFADDVGGLSRGE